MDLFTSLDTICMLICIFSGLILFFLWMLEPSTIITRPMSTVGIFKTVFGVIFLVSGAIEFICEIISLFS